MMYRQTVLPYRKGFNLSYLMCPQKGIDAGNQENYRKELREQNPISYELINSDLEMIADLGFNFVRFPLNYINFIQNYNDFWKGSDFEFKEREIAIIDKAVERAAELGIYAELSLHRAPGYTVGRIEPDPYSLWKDDDADKAFVNIWKKLTERYRAVSATKLGFNLVNEPYSKYAGRRLLDIKKHNAVMRKTVNEIRALGDKRTVFLDGTNWGRESIPELCDLEGVAQSCRAYDPREVTHFSFSQDEDENGFVKWPDMPGKESHKYERQIIWTKETLYKEFEDWAKLAQERGIGVHCGEGGVVNKCPHNVALSWFSDVTDILNGFNIGFALWELRGIFGVIDSERKDCKYVDYKGHMLDKEMLDIMKRGL